MFQVNYSFPFTDIHQNQQALSSLQFRNCLLYTSDSASLNEFDVSWEFALGLKLNRKLERNVRALNVSVNVIFVKNTVIIGVSCEEVIIYTFLKCDTEWTKNNQKERKKKGGKSTVYMAS